MQEQLNNLQDCFPLPRNFNLLANARKIYVPSYSQSNQSELRQNSNARNRNFNFQHIFKSVICSLTRTGSVKQPSKTLNSQLRSTQNALRCELASQKGKQQRYSAIVNLTRLLHDEECCCAFMVTNEKDSCSAFQNNNKRYYRPRSFHRL